MRATCSGRWPTRVNPERDVHVIPGMRAHGLDLASPELLPAGLAGLAARGRQDADRRHQAGDMADAAERESFRRVRPQGRGWRTFCEGGLQRLAVALSWPEAAALRQHRRGVP